MLASPSEPALFPDPCTVGKPKRERRDHDAYFTRDLRPFAVLLAELERLGFPLHDHVWECCAGGGHLSELIKARRRLVVSTDLVDHGYSDLDEVKCLTHFSNLPGMCRSVVTNPPFQAGDIDRLIAHLLLLAKKRKGQLCLLLRHEFDAAGSACRRALFRDEHFLTKIALPFRPIFEPPMPAKEHRLTRVMFLERLEAVERRALAAVDRKNVGNPRFPYAWYVWDCRQEGGVVTQYPDARDYRGSTGAILCAGCHFEGEVIAAKCLEDELKRKEIRNESWN